MNICQLSVAHNPYDERILHKISFSLVKAGHQVVFLVPFSGDSYHVRGVSVCPLRPFRSRWVRAIILPIMAIAKFRRLHCEAVHIHDPELLMFAGIFHLLGISVVVDIHDDFEATLRDRFRRWPIFRWLTTSLWRLIERSAARISRAVITVDDVLAERFSGSCAVVLPNYPPIDFAEPAQDAPDSLFHIVYVGGVSRARGVSSVLEALNLLRDIPLCFHVIGKVRDESLVELMAQDDRVIYHGRVPWQQLREYYRYAQVGVAMYQLREGFRQVKTPVKVMEYMAAGIPTVCSRFPGLVEFVEEQGFGLTAEPEDPAEIAAVLNRLYRDEHLRRVLGETGRRAFERAYNWETVEPRLLEVYSLIGAHG